jgi:hypothetical protein
VDFDVIGYSYYPKWHYNPDTGAGSIADLTQNLTNTANAYGKPVVLVETGFASRGAQFEPQYQFPVSAAGQQQFLEAVVDAVQNVPNSLGWGAFWWYPEARPVNGMSVWEGGRYGWFDANGNLLPVISAFEGLNPDVPGDFNADGRADAGDLLIWQSQFGQLSNNIGADDDQDGDVDGADFLAWQQNVGQGLAPSASAAVPEPASSAFFCLAAIFGWSSLNSIARRCEVRRARVT